MNTNKNNKKLVVMDLSIRELILINVALEFLETEGDFIYPEDVTNLREKVKIEIKEAEQ